MEGEDKSKRKILAIVNPFSGSKKKEKIVSRLQRELNNNSISFDFLYTQYSGHGKEIAQNAILNDMDTIIAIGGDGTINEVSSQLIGSKTKLGIISLGSGNGFARHLKVHKSLDESIQIIKNNTPILVDSCKVNQQSYVNIAGIGIDGKVAYLTRNNSKRGLWPYVKATISAGFSYGAFEAELCYDNKCIYGKYKAIVIANGPLYGFNFQIAPQASVQDGLLDVMLFEDASFLKYSFELPKFVSGKLDKSKSVVNFKTKELKVVLKEKQYTHVDGEGLYSDALEYNYSINPKSLKILV